MCSNTGTAFYSATNFICPRRLLYFVCIAGVQWRSSFVFRSAGISFNSWIAFCWLNLLHDPDGGSFIQRILCPVKVTSFQSSEPIWKSFVSLTRKRCFIWVPLVPKRSSTERSIIPATDFPSAGLPALWSSIISNAASCHCVELFCFQVRSRDCKESTTRNSIDQIAWEPRHNYTVLCQGCSTSVGRHHACRVQVSSVLQQCKEDDLLLVAIDTQHHSSHHKTVLEGKLSQDQCERCSNFCWLPFGNSSEIPVLWKQGNPSADIPSFCPGNLSVPIWLSPWRSYLVCPSWWWAPMVQSHNFSA